MRLASALRDQAEGAYQMFYGDWEHICRAQSTDGRTFTRVLDAANHSAIFDEGGGNNTRDPMVLKIGNTYDAYYTAFPGNVGSVYARTSTDFLTWSASKICRERWRCRRGSLGRRVPLRRRAPRSSVSTTSFARSVTLRRPRRPRSIDPPIPWTSA